MEFALWILLLVLILKYGLCNAVTISQKLTSKSSNGTPTRSFGTKLTELEVSTFLLTMKFLWHLLIPRDSLRLPLLNQVKIKLSMQPHAQPHMTLTFHLILFILQYSHLRQQILLNKLNSQQLLNLLNNLLSKQLLHLNQLNSLPPLLNQLSYQPPLLYQQNSLPPLLNRLNNQPPLLNQHSNLPHLLNQQNNLPPLLNRLNNQPPHLKLLNNLPQHFNLLNNLQLQVHHHLQYSIQLHQLILQFPLNTNHPLLILAYLTPVS